MSTSSAGISERTSTSDESDRPDQKGAFAPQLCPIKGRLLTGSEASAPETDEMVARGRKS